MTMGQISIDTLGAAPRSGICLALLLLAACQPSPEQTEQRLAATEPATRIEALEEAFDQDRPLATVALLDDPDPQVRARAAELLGDLTDTATRVSLVRAHFVRGGTLAALRTVLAAWGTDASPTLEAALAGLDTTAGRAELTLALWQLQPARDAGALLGPLLAAGIGPAPTLDLTPWPAAAPYLIERSRDPAPVIRATASRWLGRCGDAGIPRLLQALKDPEVPVRVAAAETLGPLRDPRIVPALIAVLERLADLEMEAMDAAMADAEEDEEVSFVTEDGGLTGAVHDALVAQGDAAVAPLLLATLDEPEVDALIARMGTVAVPPLLGLLANPKDVYADRVVDILRRIPDPRSIEPLLASLKPRDPVLQESVRKALIAIGAPATTRCATLLSDPSATRRFTCAEVLAGIDDPAHAPALRAALADRDAGVVAAAARGLGKRRDAGAFEPLIKALSHTDVSVRLDAADALAKLGDPRAAAALAQRIAALDRGEGIIEITPGGYAGYVVADDDHRFRGPVPNAGRDALTTLGAAALPEVVAAYVRAPRAPAPERLLDTLAGIPAARDEPEVQDLVRTALSASDRGRRAGAARALVSLKPTGYLDALLAAFDQELTRGARGGAALGDVAAALGRTRDSKAAEALIAAAKRHRSHAIGDELLVAVGENGSPPAQAFMAAALARGDHTILAAAYGYYISHALPEGREALVRALHEAGGVDMAHALAYSGDERLESAAIAWARSNGYQVLRLPVGGEDEP